LRSKPKRPTTSPPGARTTWHAQSEWPDHRTSFKNSGLGWGRLERPQPLQRLAARELAANLPLWVLGRVNVHVQQVPREGLEQRCRDRGRAGLAVLTRSTERHD